MSAVRLTIHVQPRAKADELLGLDAAGRLRVRVTAAPAQGAANEAVIQLLARILGVPRQQVTIERGLTVRTKTVRIEGLATDDVRRVLGT